MSKNSMMERFSKLKLKERRLISIAAVAGLLLLGYQFFIDPLQQKADANRKQLEAQTREFAELQSQLPSLRQQAANPDARLRADLGTTQQQLTRIDAELQQFSHLLVTPAQMPRLLQNILSRHRGLELVSLKTIAATPLLQSSGQAAPVSAANSAAPPSGTRPAAAPPGGIYRHGLEITVAGSYHDLLAYAAELQGISPRPLWSGLALKVVEYPRSELTFTLYTLSLDLPWLAV